MIPLFTLRHVQMICWNIWASNRNIVSHVVDEGVLLLASFLSTRAKKRRTRNACLSLFGRAMHEAHRALPPQTRGIRFAFAARRSGSLLTRRRACEYSPKAKSRKGEPPTRADKKMPTEKARLSRLFSVWVGFLSFGYQVKYALVCARNSFLSKPPKDDFEEYARKIIGRAYFIILNKIDELNDANKGL